MNFVKLTNYTVFNKNKSVIFLFRRNFQRLFGVFFFRFVFWYMRKVKKTEAEKLRATLAGF